MPRTPKMSSSTLAPASSCASPRGGATICKPDRQAGRGEPAGQRQRRAADQRDRVDDAEPLDVIVELLAGAFGRRSGSRPGTAPRWSRAPAADRTCRKIPAHARHRDALRLGALDLLDRQLEAFLDVPDHLGLELVAPGAQQRRLAQRRSRRRAARGNISCASRRSGCASSTMTPASAKRCAALRVTAATSGSTGVMPRSGE